MATGYPTVEGRFGGARNKMPSRRREIVLWSLARFRLVLRRPLRVDGWVIRAWPPVPCLIQVVVEAAGCLLIRVASELLDAGRYRGASNLSAGSGLMQFGGKAPRTWLREARRMQDASQAIVAECYRNPRTQFLVNPDEVRYRDACC